MHLGCQAGKFCPPAVDDFSYLSAIITDFIPIDDFIAGNAEQLIPGSPSLVKDLEVINTLAIMVRFPLTGC